jgi:hypothetical protein
MVKRLGIFMAALLGCAVAQAEEALPDPTRPAPEAIIAVGAPARSGPVLQSVMIRPGSRTAVIGGQLLAEGDLFGEARLVKITESEVILSGPGGEQTLKLFPGVEKTSRVTQNVVPEAAPKRGKEIKNRNTERKVP